MTTSQTFLDISVVVFALNAADTIERALSSVMEQGIPDLELLVLDGGSTDGTVELIRRHENEIAFWRSAPDGGPTNAINEGVERAHGDVICLLPADDWLEPGALKPVLKEFAADPDLDVLSCGTRYVRFDADGAMQLDALFISHEALEFSMENILRDPLTAGRFIRRRVYERLGGHTSKYRFGDYDFLMRVCLSGVKSKVLSRLTYTYRRHPQSATFGENPDNILAMLGEGVRMTAHHLARNDLELADRRALLNRHRRSSAHYAWRLLARGELRKASRVVADAIRISPLWPLYAIGLLLFGRKSRDQISTMK